MPPSYIRDAALRQRKGLFNDRQDKPIFFSGLDAAM
jgi:hypothetical protein